MLALNEPPSVGVRAPVIKVCILTYGRPALLERCLATLDAQVFERIPAPDLHIAVTEGTRLIREQTQAIRARVEKDAEKLARLNDLLKTLDE